MENAQRTITPTTASGGLPRFPAAYATAYGPAGRRRRWLGMLRCPHCGGGHLTFGGTLADLSAAKRTPCGRSRVWVVVARVVVAQANADRNA